MDLSNIMTPPDMGMDYGSLLRYAQPNGAEGVVAGGNPAGNIGTAGMAGYLGMKQRERDIMLQKASQLADMQAQLKSSQAQDYQSEAPARQAQIQIQNSLGQGKLNDLPSLISAQHDTIQTGANQASAEAIQSMKAKLYPFANDWHNAKTPEDKQSVIDDMKKAGVTQIGARNLDDLPPERLDPIMQQAYNEQINTPAQVQKEQLAKVTGDEAYRRVQEIVAGRDRTTAANNRTKEEIAKGHDAAKQAAAQIIAQKPETQSQWYASMLKKVADGTITDGEHETLTYYQQSALAKAAASAQNSPDQPDMGKLGVPTQPKVIPSAVPVPKVAPKVPPEALQEYKKQVAANPGKKEQLRQLFISTLKVDPETLK